MIPIKELRKLTVIAGIYNSKLVSHSLSVDEGEHDNGSVTTPETTNLCAKIRIFQRSGEGQGNNFGFGGMQRSRTEALDVGAPSVLERQSHIASSAP